jgi:hypothetical protein
MADRDKREPDQTTAETEPYTPDLNTGWSAQDEQTLAEEEVERASMGWESDETEEAEVPSTLPEFDDYRDGDEQVIEEADGAVNTMVNREMRRNGLHTPGDDFNPGVDTDENAPKRDNLPDKKNGGSRGRSDFR